jgi:hypothetical protein
VALHSTQEDTIGFFAAQAVSQPEAGKEEAMGLYLSSGRGMEPKIFWSVRYERKGLLRGGLVTIEQYRRVVT